MMLSAAPAHDRVATDYVDHRGVAVTLRSGELAIVVRCETTWAGSYCLASSMLVDFALKYNYIALLIADIEWPLLGYPAPTISMIKGDMSRVVAIVPLTKALLAEP